MEKIILFKCRSRVVATEMGSQNYRQEDSKTEIETYVASPSARGFLSKKTASLEQMLN